PFVVRGRNQLLTEMDVPVRRPLDAVGAAAKYAVQGVQRVLRASRAQLGHPASVAIVVVGADPSRNRGDPIGAVERKGLSTLGGLVAADVVSEVPDRGASGRADVRQASVGRKVVPVLATADIGFA